MKETSCGLRTGGRELKWSARPSSSCWDTSRSWTQSSSCSASRQRSGRWGGFMLHWADVWSGRVRDRESETVCVCSNKRVGLFSGSFFCLYPYILFTCVLLSYLVSCLFMEKNEKQTILLIFLFYFRVFLLFYFLQIVCNYFSTVLQKIKEDMAFIKTAQWYLYWFSLSLLYVVLFFKWWFRMRLHLQFVFLTHCRWFRSNYEWMYLNSCCDSFSCRAAWGE